jgi:MYXO-CTERM domain-containing protein
MDDLNSQMWGNKTEIVLTVFALQRSCGQYPGTCCTTYPCEQQVGQGYDGSGYVADPIYVWNNVGTAEVGCTDYSPDECGNGLDCSDYVQEGRDYVTDAKPGYAKFTYPHPLRGDGGSDVGGNGGAGGAAGSAALGGAGAVAGGAPGGRTDATGSDEGAGCGCRSAPDSSRRGWIGALLGLLLGLRTTARRQPTPRGSSKPHDCSARATSCGGQATTMAPCGTVGGSGSCSRRCRICRTPLSASPNSTATTKRSSCTRRG